MQDDNHSKPIRLPVTQANAAELIEQLVGENFGLRQTIDQLHKTVDELANVVAMQKELIQQLRDEIATLKGQKPKPQIRPGQLEGQKRKSNWRKRIRLPDNQQKTILFSMWVNRTEGNFGITLRSSCTAIEFTPISVQIQAPGISRMAWSIMKKVRVIGKLGQPRGKSRKKKKTLLEIHDRPEIQPMHIPDCAVFKGYKPFTVQDLIIKPRNTQYQIARYQLPDGSYITGELPKGIHGHYGPELVAYILYQYHACRVTEHLLLEDIRARGILMSAGQLNNILILDKEAYHKEADELLAAGTKAEKELKTDDTGGRHKGKNQYTTVIGNRWFTIFTTTDSKSRINFLKLLQGGKEEYVINEDALQYLREASVTITGSK